VETVYNAREIRTVITPADRRVLSKIIGLFGKLVEIEPIGQYRKMTADKTWITLVSQVCVKGSARHIERINSNPSLRAEFEAAVSLTVLSRERNTVSYLANTLRSFSATRFPTRGAESLATVLKSPTVFERGRLVLFEGLSDKASAAQTRIELIKRCPIFRFKSASDFMISVGLSHDVIALDTRVVGVLQKHLGYNLTPARIQSRQALYLSLEAALRDFCHEQDRSLALLDRILFRFSSIGAIELIVKYPELTRRLRMALEDYG